MMYGLRLSDGHCWGIRSGEETAAVGRRTRPPARARTIAGPCGQDDPPGEVSAVVQARVTVARRPRTGATGQGWQVRRSPFLEIWRHRAVREIVCGLHETADFLQVREQMRCALFPVYDLTVRRGGLPLHGALVEHDGRGVLLVGRSGVGKSTACRRLPPRWNALGDDLALAVRRPGGGFAVHPLPTWSAVGPDLEKRDVGHQAGRSPRRRSSFSPRPPRTRSSRPARPWPRWSWPMRP